VESLLGFLRTDIAHSVGITRDPEVKILKINKENTRHIPIQFTNTNLIEKSLQLLKKEISDELDIITLPWTDGWASFRPLNDLHENLREILAPEILQHIPRTYDTIGNLAILEIDRWGELSETIGSDSNLQQILTTVGDTIINSHKNITSVLRKVGNIQGEFRIRKYEVISGSTQTSTLHKENNCVFYVDPSKMFFSPRLSYERNRVSFLKFEKNPLVLDCFAGCGPYAIQIACKNDVQVHGIEKNPDAFKFFEKNIGLNGKRLKGTISPFKGDFRDFFKSNEGKSCFNGVNYIIMNLPERSQEFIPAIVPFVRQDKTYLVFYSFLKSSTPLQDAESKLMSLLQDNHLIVKEIVQKRIVFSYSPNQNNVGIDVIIKKEI